MLNFSYLIKGRVWIFGDNVDTDQILPGYAMAEPVDELKNFALAGSEQKNFAQEVAFGDIIIAGSNFGSGSSREQAAVALKTAGTGIILASSFARIFRRNAINIGLPLVKADLLEYFQDGQQAQVDLENFQITNLSTKQVFAFEPISPNIMETLTAGGLIEKVRKKLLDARSK